MAFYFFDYILCCLLQNVCSPITEVSLWKSFLAESLLETFPQLVHCLLCMWLFVSPDTDNSLLSKYLIARIINDFVHINCVKKRSYTLHPFLQV